MKRTFQPLGLSARFISDCALPVLLLLAIHGQEAPKPATHGIVIANIDRGVRPGDDFYQFANGSWIKRTEIPPDRGSIGVFTALSDLADKRVAALIEEAA